MTDPAPAPPETPPLAPPRKRNRLRYAIVAVLCLGAVGWMLVLMQKNVVFFKTVSQAVHDESRDGVRTMRIGGGVIPDSINQHSDGADFDLTEGGVTVHVHHVGNEPELFKACAPVVAEGHWSAPGSDDVRLDAPADQARRRLQAAEDRRRSAPTTRVGSGGSESAARLRPAHDRHRRLRTGARDARGRPRHRAARAARRSAGATSS